MIEFQRKVFEFKLDGNVYKVKNPSVKDVQAFQKESEKVSEGDSIEMTVEFLAGLGLPKDVAYGMEADHLTTVVNHISGQAK